MPQAIGALILGIIGVSATATIAGISIASLIGSVVLTGALIALQVLLTPKPQIPKPEDVRNPLKQPMPPRMSGFGRVRLAGAYMLFEAHNGNSIDVLAFHDGRIKGFLSWYLNDRPVTVDGTHTVIELPDGSFRFTAVRIFWRNGEDTETYYPEVAAWLPAGRYTEDYRGDGIASVALLCRAVRAKNVMETYGGRLPIVNGVAELQLLYDWRDPDQVLADKSTHVYSDNPVIELAYYLTNDTAGCMGLSFDQLIGRSKLAMWAAAADICDEDVPLKAGGTEKRYRSWGAYQHLTEPQQVISMLLATFDGWMVPDGDGSLLLLAGGYEEPDEIITADDIIDYTINRGSATEDAVTDLIVSYTSEKHNYSTQEAQMWSVPDTGRKRRTEQVDVPWCPSFSQARRLGKIELSRLSSPVTGTMRLHLVGNKAMRKRWLRVQNPEVSTLSDIRIQVQDVQTDLATMTLIVEWIQAAPTGYSWVPEVDEGIEPPVLDRVGDDDYPVPVINSMVVQAVSPNSLIVSITVTLLDYDRADLDPMLQYRLTDDGTGSPGAWSPEIIFSNVDPAGGFYTLVLQNLQANTSYDIEAATIKRGKASPWSLPQTISTAVNLVAPDPPIIGTITTAGGVASIPLTAPNSQNVDHLIVFRVVTGGGFGAATPVSGPLYIVPNQTITYADTPPSAGTWDWFATAVSKASVSSTPAGPETATV